MNIRKLLVQLQMPLVGMLAMPMALADTENPVLSDTFTFRLGGIYNEIGGDVTIARRPLPVTPVDIEDVLNIDTREGSPWVAFRWRFSDRWALNFHFNRFNKSGNGEVSNEFNLDGIVYPAGARIDSDLRADAYIMDISYNFWQGRNHEVGMGFGVHAFDFELKAKGAVLVGEVYDEYAASSDSLIAPVPNLRIFGTYAFGPKTSITLNAGWLSVSYQDYDGDFYYIESHVEYRFTERWGAGIGTQYTDVKVEHDSGGGDFEKYNVNFSGVQAYITYSF